MSALLSTPQHVIDDPRHQRTILLTVCIALMAVIASVSGLNVAQPELARAFDASQTEVLWFINIYTISLSALLLPLGALGDRLGRKPMLIAGLIVFGIANVAAGLATTTAMMLLARALAGVGAAIIMPITLAVITSTFPEERRAHAIGIWTGVAGGGGILGMYLSAILVDLATWRWLFAMPIALVSIALWMTLRSVPNSRETPSGRFDAIGSLASLIAVASISFTIHEGPERGWTTPLVIAGLILSLAATLGFIVWERHHPSPILDVRLFRDRNLSSGSLSLLIVFGVQAGIFVVVFPFFQSVLGWSGFRATFAMMPMALLMMAASGLAPRLAGHLDNRRTMAIGILLGTGGLVLLATLASRDGGYPSVLPGMLMMGLGMGLTMTPATQVITSALPRDRQGVASALNDVTRELGTALGVALLGAILSAGYRRTISDHLANIPPDTAASAREGIATALDTGSTLGPDGDALIRAAQDAFVAGWHQAMWVGTIAMLALAAFVVLRGPHDDTPANAPGAGGE